MKKFLIFIFAFALAVCSVGSVGSVYASDTKGIDREFVFDIETNSFSIDGYSYTITNEEALSAIASWGDVAFTVFYEPEWRNTQWYYRYRIILYPYTSNLYIYTYWHTTLQEWYTVANSYNSTTETATQFIRLGFTWYSDDLGSPDDMSYTNIYNEQAFVVSSYDFSKSATVEEVQTQLLDYTYTTRTVFHYDNDNQTYTNLVFRKPLPVVTGTLGEIVAELEMNPLKEIVMIVPLMMVCLVGYLALRKALSILGQLLHKA